MYCLESLTSEQPHAGAEGRPHGRAGLTDGADQHVATKGHTGNHGCSRQRILDKDGELADEGGESGRHIQDQN